MGELRRLVEGGDARPCLSFMHPSKARGAELGLLSTFTLCHHTYCLGDSPLLTTTPTRGMRDTQLLHKASLPSQSQGSSRIQGGEKSQGAHFLLQPNFCLGLSTAGAAYPNGWLCPPGQRGAMGKAGPWGN